jgi:uncharacterized protein (TIGR01777 family)
MKIVIAGGSGFLGRPLTHDLLSKGHQVTVLTRGPSRDERGIRHVTWDADEEPGAWHAVIDGVDAVVNLAGAGIADARWTAARKQVLRGSRVDATRALVAAIRGVHVKPRVLLSGSAVGIYGSQPEDGPPLDESAAAGSDFLSQLAVDWEAEAGAASALGCRVVTLRTGVVLARDGGALQKLIPPFRFFVGGPIGSGRQIMSWIHRNDWVELVVWLLRHESAEGPFNATAPHPVTNAEFSRALGAALGRPSWLPVPGIALTIALGEMAGAMLLSGQRAVPRKAVDAGFSFQFAEIGAAMRSAVR